MIQKREASMNIPGIDSSTGKVFLRKC